MSDLVVEEGTTLSSLIVNWLLYDSDADGSRVWYTAVQKM